MRRALITSLAIIATIALGACDTGFQQTVIPAASIAAPASAASNAAGPAASQAPAANDAVTIQNFAFGPAALTVTSGAAVTWTNRDGTVHSVKWDDGTAGSARLATGAVYSRTFTAPGTYSYVCGIHASMHGTIVVN